MGQLALIHTHKGLKGTLFITTKHNMGQLAMIHTHERSSHHLLVVSVLRCDVTCQGQDTRTKKVKSNAIYYDETQHATISNDT